MKYVLTVKSKKALSLMIAVVMMVSLIGFGSFVKAADGTGAISVTKIEQDADENPLTNKRIEKFLTRGDSVTMGRLNAGAGNWFTYAKVDVAAAKSEPEGIDFDIVNGSGLAKIGVGNIKIVTTDVKNALGTYDYIVFTILNWSSSSKKWDLLARTTLPSGGFSNSMVSHPYAGSGITINCPPPAPDGTIAVYFHGQGVDTWEYEEVAVDFIFQIVKVVGGVETPVAITSNNITFRSQDGMVISNGGAILNGGADGKFTLKNGITASIGGLPAGTYRIIEETNNAYVTTIRPTDIEGVVAELTVSDDGVLKPVVFENKMRSYKMTISKEVVTDEGVTWNEETRGDDEFTVEVTFKGNNLEAIKNDKGFTSNNGGAVWTGTLKHGDVVTFSNLSPGTEYTVKETYMRPSYELITPSGDLKGTILAESVEPPAVLLENKYTPIAELPIKASKTVSKGDAAFTLPSSWRFEFSLFNYDMNGDMTGQRVTPALSTLPVSSSAAAADFYVGIKTPGTYYFLLMETPSSSGGWTSDGTYYLLEATAALVGDELEITGTPTVSTSTSLTGPWSGPSTDYNDSVITFNNVYKPAQATYKLLQGTKNVTSGAPAKTTFTFIIEDVTGAVNPVTDPGTELARISRLDGGSIPFQNLPQFTFTMPGHYTYRISEDPEGFDDKWTLAPPVILYINVTDTGTGTLTAKAYRSNTFSGSEITSSDLTFRNVYTPPPSPVTPAKTSLRSTKSASGSGVPASWSFYIDIYESNANGDALLILDSKEAKNNARTVIFNEMTFTSAGTYYFLIKEKGPSGNYWTLDSSEYLIRITATEKNNAISLTREYIKRTNSAVSWPNARDYKNYTDSIVSFTNRYEYTPGRISLTLPGAKSVNSGAPNARFGFTVRDKDGKFVTSATRDGAGQFSFTMDFTQTSYPDGKYKYMISEDAQIYREDTVNDIWVEDTDWSQLTPPVTFYIKITSSGSAMNAEAFSDDDCTQPLTIEDLTFFNEYTKNYFDLALIKYVSKVNNTETGQTGTETPKPVPTVKRGDKVFYTIQIFNQGTLPGYAEEIVDRIPAGLDFVSEDNPGWTYDEATRTARTTALKDRLLDPGDSDTVEIILTVRQDVTSGSRLQNVAEISKHSDENHNPIDDIDSTPDNNVPDEDDQDYAEVRVESDRDDTDKTTPDPDPDPKPGPDPDPQPDPKPEPDPEPPPELPDNNNKTQPPGGKDRTVPPNPTIINNTLVPTDEGVFVEFDEDGVPLGEWHWDDPLEMWVFEEYPPPLGEWEALPQTGTAGYMSVYLALLGITLLGTGVVLINDNRYRAKHLKRGR